MRPRGADIRFALPVLIGPALNPLNSTMFAVALVSIAEDLELSGTDAAWTIGVLYIVSAISQPLLGTLADRAGSRWILVAGMAAVALGGLTPAVFPSYPGVLLGRLLIGLGTAAAYPSSLSLIAKRAQREGAGASHWIVSSQPIATIAGTALGPVLGGVLTALGGWTAAFLVNIPLAATVAIFALLWVERDDRSAAGVRRRRVDIVGMALFSITVTSLMSFLLSPRISLSWLLVIGAVAVAGLFAQSHSHPAPFLDLAYLRSNPPLVRTYARSFLAFLATYLFMFGFPVWAQGFRGLSPELSGQVQLPFALVGIFTSLIAARAGGRYAILIIGFIASAASGLLLLPLGPTTAVILLFGVSTVFGIMHGYTSVGNQITLFDHAPASSMAALAGLGRTITYVAAVIASAIVGQALAPGAPADGIRFVGVVVTSCGVLGLLLLVRHRRRGPRNTTE